MKTIFTITTLLIITGCSSFNRNNSPVMNPEWETAAGIEGEENKLRCEVSDASIDTIIFKIWPYPADRSSDKPIAVLTAPVKNETAEAGWTYSYNSETDPILTEKPRFFFTAETPAGFETESPVITYSGVIYVELLDENGKPMADVKYRLVGQNGITITGTTDKQGKNIHRNTVPGSYRMITE